MGGSDGSVIEAGTRVPHLDAQDVVYHHGDLDGLTLLEPCVSDAVRNELADQQGDVVEHVGADGVCERLDAGSRFPARDRLGRKSDIEGDWHGDLPVAGWANRLTEVVPTSVVANPRGEA